MTQSPLSLAYPLTSLDEIILKTVILHPGIARGNLADTLTGHGIIPQETFDRVRSLVAIGVITIRSEQIRPIDGLMVVHGVAYIGGAT